MAEDGKPQIAYGLQGVVIDDTHICKIDGEVGKLYYYGYSIEDLAERCSYEEVIYLLLKGELPNADQLAALKKELAEARGLPYASWGIGIAENSEHKEEAWKLVEFLMDAETNSQLSSIANAFPGT